MPKYPIKSLGGAFINNTCMEQLGIQSLFDRNKNSSFKNNLFHPLYNLRSLKVSQKSASSTYKYLVNSNSRILTFRVEEVHAFKKVHVLPHYPYYYCV